MELTGRKALVTGASRGIGREIALGLAREGCDVAASYSSQRERAEQLASEIEALGRKGVVQRCDVAKPAEVAAFFERAQAELGAIDIVVASAGIELIDTPFVAYSEAQYDLVFDINAKGTFFTLQEAAKRVSVGGRIMVICSNTTVLALPGFAVYGASKLAPKYFVEVLAKELGPRGITVNSLSPGVTRAAGVFTATPDDDTYLQAMTRATPLGRLGTPATSPTPCCCWRATAHRSSPAITSLATVARRFETLKTSV